MANITHLQRVTAQRQIDEYISMHRLHSYRNCNPQDFSNHVQTLVRLLRTIHDHNLAMVAKKMHSIADDVESNELNESKPNGHHITAAREIRKRANRIEQDDCPWQELMPLLSEHPKLMALASALWFANPKQNDRWDADLAAVQIPIWGEGSSALVNLRTCAARLTKFLAKNGINLKIGVKAAASPKIIRCELLGIDDEEIDNAVDDWQEAQSRETLQRTAEARATKGKKKAGSKSGTRVPRVIKTKQKGSEKS